MNYQSYPTDLSDAEWKKIRPLLPPEKPVGKQREVDLREVLNAIFYRADNGIKWRALPSDFPAIALRAFKKGRLSMVTSAYGSDWGFGSRLMRSLVEQVRVAAGREPEPSLVIIDSQSVKLGQKGGRNRALTATKRSRDANVILSSMS